MLINRSPEERVVPRHYTDKELYERGLLVPHCGNCKHHAGFLRCAAFPKEIPFPIRSGGLDPLEPRPGDGGIQYEPRE
jgi:hypothetical protein